MSTQTEFQAPFEVVTLGQSTRQWMAPSGTYLNVERNTVPSLVLSDLSKTFKQSFAIANATLASSGLTVARTFTLPDQAGTVRLTLSTDDSVAAKLYASSNIR